MKMGTRDKPKITVGILTYNRREAVLKAIQSAFDQGFADMEVIVVDSNSQDGTLEAVRKQFPEVKLICLPRNLGCPGGRNHVYANATGDYIVNMDDDGWLGDHALERIVETFELDSSISIICMRRCFPEEEIAVGTKDDGDVTEVGSFRGGVSAFRRKMLEEIGFYPEDFFFFKEEEFLTLRALNAGYKIVDRPDILMWDAQVSHGHCKRSVAVARHSFDPQTVPRGSRSEILSPPVGAQQTLDEQTQAECRR